MSSSGELFNLYCKGKGFIGYPADEGYYDQDQEIDIAQAAWDAAWDAAMAQAIPEGWQLVPVSPTAEMLEAAADLPIKATRGMHDAACYKVMLAAAPKPELKLTLGIAPIGTLAPCIMGGHWYRTERGWKWNGPDGSGGTFPRPGGDWTGELIAPKQEGGAA